MNKSPSKPLNRLTDLGFNLNTLFSHGTSRRFAYIGYRTEKEARAALKYFNDTYIDTSKIIVEKAKPVRNYLLATFLQIASAKLCMITLSYSFLGIPPRSVTPRFPAPGAFTLSVPQPTIEPTARLLQILPPHARPPRPNATLPSRPISRRSSSICARSTRTLRTHCCASILTL